VGWVVGWKNVRIPPRTPPSPTEFMNHCTSITDSESLVDELSLLHLIDHGDSEILVQQAGPPRRIFNGIPGECLGKVLWNADPMLVRDS